MNEDLLLVSVTSAATCFPKICLMHIYLLNIISIMKGMKRFKCDTLLINFRVNMINANYNLLLLYITIKTIIYTTGQSHVKYRQKVIGKEL